MSTIPRGKRRTRAQEKEESTGKQATGTGVKPKKTRSGFDVERVVEEVLDQVYMQLGLGELDLGEETARTIAREIAEMVVSSYASKPSPDSILRKIQRSREQVNEYIAGRILEMIEKPGPLTLEFLVSNGGRAILREVGRIYKLLSEYNRLDLVDALQNLWNKYGGKGMVRCPKCGFNSVSPDYTCIVCGSPVPEKHVREELGFAEKFKQYVKAASIAELREVLDAGFLLADAYGVYNPRSMSIRGRKTPLYPIYLKRSEVGFIIEEINSRDIRV
ncbi:hypothetical protein [Desulfurococcus mucosus]|uniref:Uncharacterized protein n=1 Tax=Desulfurococcus mucosus (strain ATCC 35584 / DSM 2162 / JCM 9187 / O7/1) TaxID=765177 RepID=E8RA06_DESM0|nr:hypothetical protein [Desulfurococcus mucosus]ADV65332.1 hypothetical protein Desmu_1030 [Desulfurococcus mucosus DSM 2162]